MSFDERPDEPDPGLPKEPQLISAAEVAGRWGIGRRWVYEHAEELGAIRLGAGARPRLRFDPEAVAERLGELVGGCGGEARARPRDDCDSDSLSGRSGAIVRRQARKRPGRRANAPRPGAGIGGATKRLSIRSPHVALPIPPPGDERKSAVAKATGEVKVREWKSGRGYALRFSAYGKRRYLTLGFERDGWTRERAEEELANVLADVRRGIWTPPRKGSGDESEAPQRAEAPLFGAFARELVAGRRGQVSESTTTHAEWALGHLVPYFGEWELGEIDIEAVDAYRQHKVQESEVRARAIERGRPVRNDHGQTLRPLSPGSINRTISFIQWVLSVALEYGHVAENAAVGRRRRLPERRPAPVHLDTTGQIEALLDAAAELDRDPDWSCRERQAIVGTLVFAGPRAHELCAMRWRDVDLANGRLLVGASKTDAGLREISILPVLRDLLAAHKVAAYRSGPEDLVFPTATGGRRDADNLRNRVLAPTFERADKLLERRGLVPLPKGLTAHKLRHTFASVLIACGEDPISVMRQIGHADPAFTLRVYTHLMSRDPAERKRLKALVGGERVIACQPPPPESVDLAAYELPILRILAERGGRASRSEVLAALEGAMADRHSERDLEALPSGPLRWQPRVGKVRIRLVGRGWLAVSGRGPGCEWELTELGWAKLRREEKKTKPDPPDRMSETDLAVAA